MEKQELLGHLGKLKKLSGKKLMWATFDEEQERFYLFFEGMDAIAVDGIVYVDNGKELATKILQERLGDAQHVMSLKSLLESKEVSKDAPKLQVELKTENHGAALKMEGAQDDQLQSRAAEKPAQADPQA